MSNAPGHSLEHIPGVYTSASHALVIFLKTSLKCRWSHFASCSCLRQAHHTGCPYVLILPTSGWQHGNRTSAVGMSTTQQPQASVLAGRHSFQWQASFPAGWMSCGVQQPLYREPEFAWMTCGTWQPLCREPESAWMTCGAQQPLCREPEFAWMTCGTQQPLCREPEFAWMTCCAQQPLCREPEFVWMSCGTQKPLCRELEFAWMTCSAQQPLCGEREFLFE